jgi:hypothetical protein
MDTDVVVEAALLEPDLLALETSRVRSQRRHLPPLESPDLVLTMGPHRGHAIALVVRRVSLG